MSWGFSGFPQKPYATQSRIDPALDCRPEGAILLPCLESLEGVSRCTFLPPPWNRLHVMPGSPRRVGAEAGAHSICCRRSGKGHAHRLPSSKRSMSSPKYAAINDWFSSLFAGWCHWEIASHYDKTTRTGVRVGLECSRSPFGEKAGIKLFWKLSWNITFSCEWCCVLSFQRTL